MDEPNPEKSDAVQRASGGEYARLATGDDVIARAIRSAGISNRAIYEMVRRGLRSRGARGTLVDVGCGTGNLLPFANGPSLSALASGSAV